MRRFWEETRIPETWVPFASIFTTFPTWSWQKKHKKEKLMYRVADEWEEWWWWSVLKIEMGGHYIDMCPSDTTFTKEDPYYMHKVMEVHYWEFQCSTLSSCFNGWEFMNSNVQHYLLVLMAENSWARRGIFMIIEFLKLEFQKIWVSKVW